MRLRTRGGPLAATGFLPPSLLPLPLGWLTPLPWRPASPEARVVSAERSQGTTAHGVEEILAVHHRRLIDQARLAYMLARLEATRGYRDLGYASMTAFAGSLLGYGGGGHYRLYIVSDQFAGKSTLARHRMIYSALGEMMKHEIHALNIKACTREEL